MKKLFLLFLISCFSVALSQQPKNRFEESEHGGLERTVDQSQNQDRDVPQANPGNPGETAPIDDYLPLLGIAAVGIIIYYTRQKKNAIPNK